MTGHTPNDRESALLAGGRIALRAEDLTEREIAALSASSPVEDVSGHGPYEMADIPDVVEAGGAAASSDGADPGVEFWWVEVDGRPGIMPAEVMRASALGEFQDPPQPWHAHVPGSEEILWPDRVRLVRRITPADPSEIRVRLTGEGHAIVMAPGNPSMRIVAGADRLAAATGQRVAELVAEAMASEARRTSGIEPVPSKEFVDSLRTHAGRIAGRPRSVEGTS